MTDWMLVGPTDHWKTALAKKTWGYRDVPTYKRLRSRIKSRDRLIFYVISPIIGAIGTGTVSGAVFQSNKLTWSDEIASGKVIYKLKFRFRPSQVIKPETWFENAVKLSTLGLPKGWNGWLRKAVNLVSADAFTKVVHAMPIVPTSRDIAKAEEIISRTLSKPFKPFSDGRKMTSVQRIAREQAFGNTISDQYDGTCAICESRWSVEGKFEVEAAHIIPKKDQGSDDLRNGVSLCRFHHWAFDHGLFSFSDEMEIIVSSNLQACSNNPQALASLASKRAIFPKTDDARPSQMALKWHRENVLLH